MNQQEAETTESASVTTGSSTSGGIDDDASPIPSLRGQQSTAFREPTAVKPDTAYTTSTGVRVEVYTSAGDVDGNDADWRQVNQFAYMVNSVPKGSAFYTTVYNAFWDGDVPKLVDGKWKVYGSNGKAKASKDVYSPTTAFVNQLNLYTSASDRKKYVNVLGNTSTIKDAVKNKSSLGTLLTKAGVVKLCKTGLGACLATRTSGSPLMHAKYALFSKTKDYTGKVWSDVVWITSANLNGTSGGRKSNFSIALYGDAAAYNGIKAGVWDPQNSETFTAAFKNAATNGIAAQAPNVTFFPSPRSVDLEAGYLYWVAAKKKTDCTVNLVHSLFSTARRTTANGLAALQRSGCKVRLVLGDSSMADIADSYFSMGTSLREIVNRVEFANVHDKTIAVRYKENGRWQGGTWAGSANLNGTSLYFDELAVRVIESGTSTASLPVTSAALLQFDRLYPLSRAGASVKGVKSVTASRSSVTIALDSRKTVALKATVAPSNASVPGVYWRSSDDEVATVDSSGRVTGKKAGTATITVASLSRDKSDKVTVTVVDSGSTTADSPGTSAPKLSVTAPPYLTIKRYDTPKAKRNVVVTWAQGSTEMSGKVQLQYLSAAGKWVNSSKITVVNGLGKMTKLFTSSRVWRVKALSVSSPKKWTIASSGRYSGYAPVATRDKAATTTPKIWGTPTVKKNQQALFLLQWRNPYDKTRPSRVWLQYHNGKKWVTYKESIVTYYTIPKGETVVVAKAVVTKTRKWRFKTSTLAQPKGKKVKASKAMTVKVIK